MLKRISYSILVIAISMTSLTMCSRESHTSDNGDETPEPEITAYYPKASDSFRIMSYNVGNFSKYLPFYENLDMVAAMIKEAKADVVTLNEIDSMTTRHPVNELDLLAKAIGGWQWHFGRAMSYQGGAYGEGCIVPGNVNILKKYTVALPQDEGAEPRVLTVIETDKYILGSTHLDHVSLAARVVQANVINAWAQENYFRSEKPVFLCGDMNSQSGSEVIETLRQSWNLLSTIENTFSSRKPRNCIDYIFHYKRSLPVKKVEAHTMTKFYDGDVTMASDHLPIYVDVEF